MSRIYDNWEKLVGAVLKREDLRRLALCESFSSSNFSSRPSFDSADPAAPSSLGNIMAIQFEEIKLATQNFQPDMLLGKGRYGPVYKGWIHEHFLTAVKPGSGIAVAVKMLNKRGIFSWSQPHHPNLVKLIGYSFEEDHRVSVLVYEFMPNGSLDNHLFTRGHQLLSWETRVKVAIGAARGLSFFHDSAIMVTHEGVKSSSILLDDEFNAQFSDLDLTTAAPSLIHTISTPVGKDYAAPEYIAPDRLTMKSDVYSFGIILLELLSGLRVCDKNRPIKEQNLVVWAKPYLMNKRKLVQIVDSRLEGQYPHDGAYKICKLAYQCLSSDPKLRPRMTEVVDALEQLSSSLSPASHYRQDPAELRSGWSKLSVLGQGKKLVHCPTARARVLQALERYGNISVSDILNKENPLVGPAENSFSFNMPHPRSKKDYSCGAPNSTPVRPTSAGKLLSASDGPLPKKAKTTKTGTAAPLAPFGTISRPGEGSRSMRSADRSARATAPIPPAPPVGFASGSDKAVDPNWLVPLFDHVRKIAVIPSRVASIPTDSIDLVTYAERQTILATLATNEVRRRLEVETAKQVAEVSRLEGSVGELDRSLAALKAENCKLKEAPMKLQEELASLVVEKKELAAKFASDLEESAKREEAMKLEIAELQRLAEASAAEESTLKAEIESFKAGKGLDPDLVWDSQEWADFREDVVYETAKDLHQEIMAECGGDATKYLDFLERQRNDVLTARTAPQDG